MQTFITGLAAVIAAITFLGWMASQVNEWAFVVVVGVGVACMIADFIQGARNPNGRG